MEEAVMATFNDVRFIEGITKMNQENWQKYFGNILPNGVYNGLNRRPITGSLQYRMNDGIVLANGILAKIETEDGYTDIPLVYGVDYMDKFICARVNFTDELVELIQKTDISGATLSDTDETINAKFLSTMMEFSYDESYCCERNSSFWDIPLLYVTRLNNSTATNRYWLCDGVDLSRNVSLGGNNIHKTNEFANYSYVLYGKDIVTKETEAYYSDGTVVGTIHLDVFDKPNGCMFSYYNPHAYSYSYKIRINKNPYFTFDGYQSAHNVNTNYKFNFVFSNPAIWTNNTEYYETTFSKNSFTLRITCIDVDYASGTKCKYTMFVEDL